MVDPTDPESDETEMSGASGNDGKSQPAGTVENEPRRLARQLGAFKSIYRLSLKELKEILRDRRTIITLIAMPLLIYPLLSILLQKFYLTSALPEEKVAYRYVFDEVTLDNDKKPIDVVENGFKLKDRELTDLFLAQFINLGEAYVFPELEFPLKDFFEPLTVETENPNFVQDFEIRYFEDNELGTRSESSPTLEELVEEGKADVGIRIFRMPGRKFLEMEIVQLKSGISARAADYVRKRVDATNEVMARMQFVRLRRDWSGLPYFTKSLEEVKQATASISMASLVPLILILMTVTGAVYPAIDLTAGERERGTLEALIAAPIPRFQVLLAKFVGVLTVAMLTAILNMVGMFSTLAAFGILPKLFGAGAFNWWSILLVFGLLLLFAGFFSAVLLAVTSFARSFKEAQAYIVPVTLLSITPGIISLSPGLELNGVLTVIPLLNIVLLARSIMEGTAASIPAIAAITSTTLYGLAALSIAAHIFGSDSILYGSQSSWKSMLRRPRESTTTISLTRSLACLAVLFPLSFMSLALVGRVPQWYADFYAIEVEQVPYWTQLVPFVISTILIFVLVPVFFLWQGRIRVAPAVGIQFGVFAAYPAAILIGVCLWPLSGQMVESINQSFAWFNGELGEPEWKAKLLEKAQQIVEQWRTISPLLIVGCFSIVPAICEEFFFRGVLLRSLLTKRNPLAAIILSALIFGVFHTLSLTDLSSQKFLPSFVAGILLAWVAVKSNSLLPGMILHSLNNGILVSLAYYENRLVDWGWMEPDQEGFPVWALVVSGVGLVAGCLILKCLVRPDKQASQPGYFSGMSKPETRENASSF